ncbi:MAG: class I SAM-dependent methyltransferase, partial [Candidatus Paceibacterota bacterium]
ITFFSALWIRFAIRNGIDRLNNRLFMKLGYLPIKDHYYQPLINPQKHLKKPLREDREIGGVDMNIEEQLTLLNDFNYKEELLRLPLSKTKELEFYYNNGSYCSGDAEYLYNVIRYFKPNNIIEIGSGNSTLMARNAIVSNQLEAEDYQCNHICIEPFEMDWLSNIDVKLERKKVEDIDLSFFKTLNKNDVLFIDSSHIIRPQGDVLYEILEILPILNSGVIVHFHDIFTPKDYLDAWVYEKHLLWNEQYLLEAFMSFNSEYRVIGALNYLSHNYKEEFSKACPVFAKQKDREPGAFWIVKK